MRFLNSLSLLFLGARLDLSTAASVANRDIRNSRSIGLPALSFPQAATHESQPPQGGVLVPPFFQETPIPPANPLFYPTKPFRIVTNNWLYPNGNVGKYLAQGAFPPGDVLFTTDDPSKSPVFAIDEDLRLFQYDTLAQIAPNGEPMYAFYGKGWYDLGRAIIVPFNTVERIKQWGYIYHEWSISGKVLYAVNPYSKERAPLVMQLCDRSYKNLWVMGVELERGCTPIAVTIEYVEDDE